MRTISINPLSKSTAPNGVQRGRCVPTISTMRTFLSVGSFWPPKRSTARLCPCISKPRTSYFGPQGAWPISSTERVPSSAITSRAWLSASTTITTPLTFWRFVSLQLNVYRYVSFHLWPTRFTSILQELESSTRSQKVRFSKFFPYQEILHPSRSIPKPRS